jgi:hypothetical protein
MFVCCVCCVLSGRDLCDKLITRTEESYRLWCIFECDLETLWMRRPWSTDGCCGGGETNFKSNHPLSFCYKNNTKVTMFCFLSPNKSNCGLWFIMPFFWIKTMSP